MRAWLTVLVALTLAGCKDKDGDSGGEEGEELPAGGDDGDDGDDGGDACNGTAPVIASITCENGGLQDFDGEELPVLAFLMEISDEDGDLHAYDAQIYLDETADGAVEPTDSPYGNTPGSSDGDECSTSQLNLQLGAPVNGERVEFSTRYEFGIVVTDGNGVDSEMVTIACTTPAEDGTGDPDPLPTGGAE